MAAQQPFKISLLDLATLLYHVHRGAQMDEVGFEDCERTLQQLTRELSPVRARIAPGSLESALWSCNLMDEVDEWWSPTGESFESFVARLLRYATKEQRYEFDKFYNSLKKTEPLDSE